MAFTDGTPGVGTDVPAAPDYSPAAWPEPVALLPRQPLDLLGTVLIPAPERQLFTRGPDTDPATAPQPPTGPATPAAAAPPAAIAAVAAVAAPDTPALRRAPAGPRTRRLTLPGSAETRRRHLLDRIRVPLRACHRIAVLGSPTEGITTVLGALLAEHRADPVLVLVPGGPAQGEHRTAGRLVVHAVQPDPATLPATLTELSGHYPVILADTTASPVDLRLPAVELAHQLVLCEPSSATGAHNANTLLDHLTALGHHGLVHGAATVFTPAPPADRPIAERDLLTHFRTRCRGAVALPPHNPADPTTLRPRTRDGYLELAALIGDAMADRQG
ncbi:MULTISPECIES: hypothetical protein [unclassified Kitasatospora]|uniref:hypothetical protein n=1 Tax=unclassified Kitasatospora TaxID=2633591 RepID=UPI0033FC50CA